MSKKPLVMGILNLTPDSFSGDGFFKNVSKAVDQASLFIQEGADILDIGGESSRPGAEPVSLQEEMDRVFPLMEAIGDRFSTLLSIDTRHFEVAEGAIARGANILNDISAGNDARMLELARQKGAIYVFMHMQNDPQTMQRDPSYPNGVVSEVFHFLQKRIIDSEISKEKVWVDPGIGFGKTVEHNLSLLHHLSSFKELGDRVLIGTSRKSFIGSGDRREGTLASNLWARHKGASVFRVHEVAPMVRALKMWEGISNASL